ncbi:phosphoenolpyruvate carboxykinase (ATP) [Acidaminobacter hydrogenoformans]|uniref:Phosphoenolpyruvate carboxykinase (ATP) n=1 Tax=Acidaminobacter hydrogenoformans DSM 2784 TaxID=1120920 RepID=A0A1G5RRA5_9FIRM|nr:phosphoenolpyruvate carboxykinase (ATP) [Acidaminobacter hydrogenoformans]SCZ76574.1 phosphoenolpyruvate carboxykinase (ATP) [Acidaminobacter hydrogenoformans DSM 2784]
MDYTAYLKKLAIYNVGDVFDNLPPARLVEQALINREGVLSSTGALAIRTGKYTGRSPLDRFIVDSPNVHDKISWGKINQPMTEDVYWRIYYRLTAYLEDRDLYIFQGYSGTDPKHRIPISVINQYAWQNLFARQLFVRPSAEELENHVPEYTLLCVPGFNAFTNVDRTRSEAFVILNLEEKTVIIGGTRYAGEMKKAIFTVMNYLLPEAGVFPMHCSANINASGDTTLFFGLSGTGKTTLSADPSCQLIGDDEHGWSDEGVFNFEGGCYAKCIGLTRDKEPEIFDAVRFGAVLENVVMDPLTRISDFTTDQVTENTRAAYPLDFIPGAVPSGRGGHPKTILFLTADAFGVMPPISRLTTEQALYHFLSGYTSKLAGTERGVTEPEATFSTGFGEPFLPRNPMVYADLLRNRMDTYGTKAYLVNTGWVGGRYGTGSRIKLAYTRAMVGAAMNGDLDEVAFETEPFFGLSIPKACPGVPSEILNPRATWEDPAAYDAAAQALAERFSKNYEKFEKTKKDNLDKAAATKV